MKFKDIFSRPIDRHIDGVIKWDENDYLQQELDEYVLTPEIKKGLQLCCDEYNDPKSSANGVWISGFFGSGKSHLLKIMSYLFENAEVAGKPALDYMKPKLKQDASLLASLERTCERIPSQSILFNVGGKADMGSKDGNALLSAFIKALNGACGYSKGTQAFVAQFERDLDREGFYQDFIVDFERTTGKEWAKVRRKSWTSQASNIAASYDRVTGNPEGTNANIAEAYAMNYHPSPEDFADWAMEYIEKQEESDFHLNFFVDEMGQFIGNNDELLFSLQNVVELLNTRCKGQAWVVVVSQEEMDGIVGKMRGKSADDFSKIQDRFKVKMKIPSNDANTVVRDRLLEKSSDALPEIDKLYDKYNGDFKMLFDFPDGAFKYTTYRDREDFEGLYPLTPFQFSLFHKALTGLSEHGAFTGEYSSTGARNMLSSTRNVLVQMKDTGSTENGDLVPFDKMFDGLRNDLKSDVPASIADAEDHLESKLGVRVLKALLLVKYNDGFEATPENLRVLLYSSFKEDAIQLQASISEICKEMASQKIIRRNGLAYEYLTNEEKDVEKEIGNIIVDDTAIQKEIGELVAKDILSQTKTKYSNKNFSETYSYDLLVDGTSIGANRNELKLNILTDLTQEANARFVLMASTKELVCVLPEGSDLISEMRIYLQTKSYVAANLRGDDLRSRILSEKRDVNGKRWDELKGKITTLINGAHWATSSADITSEVKGSGAERVTHAASIMVEKSYPLLNMLTVSFDAKSIYRTAVDSKLMADEKLPEYGVETLDEIKRILGMADRCTVGGSGINSLEKRLGTGNHGWPATSVRAAVALLACNGLIECLKHDETLEKVQVAKALSEGSGLDSLAVKPSREVSDAQIEGLKDAYKQICGVTAESEDAKELADQIGKRLNDLILQYGHNAADAHILPFSTHFEEYLGKLREIAGRNRDWLIDNVANKLPEIASLISGLHDMSEFMQGNGGKSFAEAKAYLESAAANISTSTNASELAAKLREVLGDVGCYKNSAAPEANRLRREIKELVDKELGEAKKRALNSIDSFSVNFHASLEYKTASPEKQAAADAVINTEKERLSTQEQIQMLNQAVELFQRDYSDELFAALSPEDKGLTADDDSTESIPSFKKVMYKDVCRPAGYGSGRTLSSREDVENFIETLRRELLTHSDAGETIIL